MKEVHSMGVVLVVVIVITCANGLFHSSVQVSNHPSDHWDAEQALWEVDVRLRQYAAELEGVSAFYAEGHVEGLIGLLTSGKPTTKLRASRHLAVLGAVEALDAMAEQMSLCRGSNLEAAMRVSYRRLRHAQSNTRQA